MAYFTHNEETITLKHNQKVICTFKLPTEEEIKSGNGAVFTWTDEESLADDVKKENQKHYMKRKLTIATKGNLAGFVVSASAYGYSFEKYLFGKKDGKQVSVDYLNKTFSVQIYKNGVLKEEYSGTDKLYTRKKFDPNRGTYYTFTKETLPDGNIMRKIYHTYASLQSQTVYTIKTPAGRLLEEGTLDANNQKHGTIMTYDKNGRRKNSYYENGRKLSFGQRLFGFKRKVSSRTPSQHVSQNELTR